MRTWLFPLPPPCHSHPQLGVSAAHLSPAEVSGLGGTRSPLQDALFLKTSLKLLDSMSSTVLRCLGILEAGSKGFLGFLNTL